MRILFDGQALIGRQTGVGYYASCLIDALRQSEDVESLHALIGRQIVAFGENSPSASLSPSLPWSSMLKKALASVVPACRTLHHRWMSHRLSSVIERWDLMHEPNFVAPEVSIPLVTTVHDLTHALFPQFMPRDRLHWLTKSLEPTLRRSRAILTVSRSVRSTLLDRYDWLDEQRVFAAPLGIDRQRFHDSIDRDTIANLRTQYRLPHSYLLFVGTLEPRKNLRGLLLAFARMPLNVRERNPLVLVGMKGWKRGTFQGLLDRMREDGTVRVMGYVPERDVPLLMQAATVFCFPSFYEGFGLPPLEAAACGTPVLCSQTASLPEVMGDAAFYVDPDNVASIADGLTAMLEDERLRARLSGQGIARSKQFTWKKCAATTLQAYRVGRQG